MAGADPRDRARRIEYILGEPDLYPDVFKSWLPRWFALNPNLVLAESQLPAVQTVQYIGETGLPAFSGAWVNYGSGYEAAGYYKDPWGRVHLCGVVRSGAAGSVIFTLPGGYRPRGREIFSNVSGADTGFRTDVAANGDVIHVSGTTGYVSLSSISFRAYS